MEKKQKIINDFSPLKAVQKFTKSPNRFSDTSICGQLDLLSILRPSMANGQITDILKRRNYITIEKGAITVTDLGINVVDFLIESEFNFIDVEFTAHMEESLDEIAKGKKERVEVLTEFWESLKKGIEKGKQIREKNQQTNFDCPKCSAKLLLKNSKFGKFFSCSNYSNKENKCDYKADYGEDGKPKEKEKKEIVFSKFKCPICKEKMIIRKSRYGKFNGCSKFPVCDGLRDIEGEEIKPKKKTYKKYKKYKKK